jgi:hypothetical protein
LTRGPASSHHKPIYKATPYYPADPLASSVPNGIFSGLNPYARPYYLSAMTTQGYPIGHLSSSSWPEHRVPLHQEHPQIKTPLKTTLRLGAGSAGTLSLKPATSAWWVLPGHPLRTFPADTQPSEDLKRLMRGLQATESIKISIHTSMLFGSRPSWSQSNVWSLNTLH